MRKQLRVPRQLGLTHSCAESRKVTSAVGSKPLTWYSMCAARTARPASSSSDGASNTRHWRANFITSGLRAATEAKIRLARIWIGMMVFPVMTTDEWLMTHYFMLSTSILQVLFGSLYLRLQLSLFTSAYGTLWNNNLRVKILRMVHTGARCTPYP